MKFFLYNTDDADPAAATGVVSWELNAVESEYDPAYEWDGRGADIATFGGRVIQDYGQVEADRKIRVAGIHLDPDTVAALEAKYTAADEYHFTARKVAAVAETVWKVRFRRVPRGFTATLDAPTFQIGRAFSEPAPVGYERYSYEMVLLVIQKLT
jgi:hypothetical protein